VEAAPAEEAPKLISGFGQKPRHGQAIVAFPAVLFEWHKSALICTQGDSGTLRIAALIQNKAMKPGRPRNERAVYEHLPLAVVKRRTAADNAERRMMDCKEASREKPKRANMSKH